MGNWKLSYSSRNRFPQIFSARLGWKIIMKFIRPHFFDLYAFLKAIYLSSLLISRALYSFYIFVTEKVLLINRSAMVVPLPTHCDRAIPKSQLNRLFRVGTWWRHLHIMQRESLIIQRFIRWKPIWRTTTRNGISSRRLSYNYTSWLIHCMLLLK